MASLKHTATRNNNDTFKMLSTAECRGLIEARSPRPDCHAPLHGYPRLNAVASLKHEGVGAGQGRDGHRLSTAECRGLIEAARCAQSRRAGHGYPRLNAVASLKHSELDDIATALTQVIHG